MPVILNNEELVELRLAFDMACNELGFGTSTKDKVRREHLALLMSELAKGGERDPNVICAQAVRQMQEWYIQRGFIRRNLGRPPATMKGAPPFSAIFCLALGNLLRLGRFAPQPGACHEYQSKCICVRLRMV